MLESLYWPLLIFKGLLSRYFRINVFLIGFPRPLTSRGGVSKFSNIPDKILISGFVYFLLRYYFCWSLTFMLVFTTGNGSFLSLYTSSFFFVRASLFPCLPFLLLNSTRNDKKSAIRARHTYEVGSILQHSCYKRDHFQERVVTPRRSTPPLSNTQTPPMQR